jgi:hypothetical protein
MRIRVLKLLKAISNTHIARSPISCDHAHHGLVVMPAPPSLDMVNPSFGAHLVLNE